MQPERCNACMIVDFILMFSLTMQQVYNGNHSNIIYNLSLFVKTIIYLSYFIVYNDIYIYYIYIIIYDKI